MLIGRPGKQVQHTEECVSSAPCCKFLDAYSFYVTIICYLITSLDQGNDLARKIQVFCREISLDFDESSRNGALEEDLNVAGEVFQLEACYMPENLLCS